MVIENQSKRLDILDSAISTMKSTTSEGRRCCDQLSKRAMHLDSLTSPASQSTSLLSRANCNLAESLKLMKNAKEMFDTVSDCEPAIKRLYLGVIELEDKSRGGVGSFSALAGKRRGGAGNRRQRSINLKEQDVYNAGDSMDILREAYQYFDGNRHFKSVPQALKELSDVHYMGMEGMSKLIHLYLVAAGQAVRPKRSLKKDEAGKETAVETRDRLTAALQNRDLLKSIGDYEEYQPVEARAVREIRAMFECLGFHGYNLEPPPEDEPDGLKVVFGLSHIERTEKVGSGCYSSLTKETLTTGFPQLDAYGKARKNAGVSSVNNFYRRIKQRRQQSSLEQQADTEAAMAQADEDADAAALDACRCLEHAMIVIAGEKTVYRTIVVPFVNKPIEEEDETPLTRHLRKACSAAYAHSVAAVVDRALDIIETVFASEGGVGAGGLLAAFRGGSDSQLPVRTAANAAAAGLRMLDSVRMLGPSLAKLVEMPIVDTTTRGMNRSNGISHNITYTTAESTSIASILCIAIHRTTVKNAARTLENLATAIQDDPLKGPLNRPKDAGVSTVTIDTVRAIRLVAPYRAAYKSVTKRRALPWDPNIGDEAGELDSYIRFLVMRLLNSLKGKALHYIRDGFDDSQAKSNLFLMNNCYYLLQELGPRIYQLNHSDNDNIRIEDSWFTHKAFQIIESEKIKYLSHWEVLHTHLTAVAKDDIEYIEKRSDESAGLLSLESGRLIKIRFKGFNTDFDRLHGSHRKLFVISPELKSELIKEIGNVFLPRYQRFYEKYKKYKFSKKNQEEYIKYKPGEIQNAKLPELFDLAG